MESRSVADIEGPWRDPGFESSLIERCRENWCVPVAQLSNHVLATFIRQRLAHTIVIPEAQRRISAGYIDDTELYDEELVVAVEGAQMPDINSEVQQNSDSIENRLR